jgi:antitoxin component YwqK of YwqJK toxin-antitoxin module
MPRLCALFKVRQGFCLGFFLLSIFPVYAQVQREKGSLKDGKKEGEWEFYFPDGRLMAREQYSAGELNGNAISYFPDGRISQIENWIEDIPEDSAWYFHPSGSLHRKGRYKSGVYDGLWLTFYPDGKLEQSGTYRNGIPDGLFTNWFENGFLKEEGRYREGKKEGQFIFFRKAGKGKIELLANYCNDQPCGIWVWYNKRGKPQHSGFPSITN